MAELWLASTVLFLLASGFYSGTEMGLYCVNRLRIRLQAEQARKTPMRMLMDLTQRRQETVLAILLGTNLANYLLTVSGSRLIIDAFSIPADRAGFAIAAILAPLVFVFGDVVPKNWFQVDADRLMARSAVLLRGSVLLFRFTGVLWLLHALTRLVVRLTGHDAGDRWASPRAEVIGLLREGGAHGALTVEQTAIIERVMNLSDVRVSTIMVPRERVTTVPVDADRRLFERIIRGNKYSRLPVVGRDRKNIVGILNVHDALMDWRDNAIERCMRTPITIGAGESAANALVRLQRAERTMAIVTDPRRGCVGIVTLKDVVEEIFGELPAW